MEQLKLNYIDEQEELEVPAFVISARVRKQEPQTLSEFIKKRGFKAVAMPVFEIIFGGSLVLGAALIITFGLLGIGGY